MIVIVDNKMITIVINGNDNGNDDGDDNGNDNDENIKAINGNNGDNNDIMIIHVIIK